MSLIRFKLIRRLTWELWGLGVAVGKKPGTAWMELAMGPLALQFALWW